MLLMCFGNVFQVFMYCSARWLVVWVGELVFEYWVVLGMKRWSLSEYRVWVVVDVGGQLVVMVVVWSV